MRDRRLQGIEAIVERQERVPAEGDEDRLLLDREHRGFWFTRAGWQIGDGAALLPFGDGLRVDAVAQGQRPQARLTMLYRSTDRLCRCGAAVENLAHSASLHAGENGASSKLGIKQHEKRSVRCRRPPPAPSRSSRRYREWSPVALWSRRSGPQ